MSKVLYRKYRPATFDDVCGQKHITDILRYEVENNRCAHAYLFCGSRGTGKTSCAKIMAKALNCEHPVNGSPCLKCPNCLDIEAGIMTDVIEMDAASNNGVDAVRDLCDEVVFTPAVAKKKVYIIDEVHMMSTAAFNALLKTIEEPPEHVVFILATTEMHKVPTTIISRCQRFDFRRLDMRVIADRLKYIAKNEKITLEDDAALLIARQAQGGMRDAIGLFDLCASGGCDVTAEKAEEVLGLSGYDTVANTMSAVAAGDMGMIFKTLTDISMSSKDIEVFWQELISFTRDMLVSKYTEDSAEYLDLTSQEEEVLHRSAEKFTLAKLINICNILDDTAARMLRSPQTKRTAAEFAFLKMCRPELETTPEALADRISALEDKIALGIPVAPAETVPEPQSKTATPADVSGDKKAEVPPEPPAIEETKIKSTPAAPSEYEKLRDISEAVGKLDGINRGLASFLMSSDAYISSDAKHLILAVEGFAITMFQADGALSAISDAFALARITDGRADIKVVEKKQGKDVLSLADELGNLL